MTKQSQLLMVVTQESILEPKRGESLALTHHIKPPRNEDHIAKGKVSTYCSESEL